MDSVNSNNNNIDRNNSIENNVNKHKEVSWKSGSEFVTSDIKPKYKNLKEEVLNNTFASISKRAWNDTLRKCQAIYKGELESSIRNRWSQHLRDNHIGIKHLIALKLYCDFDNLQSEYRKCFRCPYNQNKDRLSSFYWWNQTLSQTFSKLNKLKCNENKKYSVLFHGVSSIMNIDSYKGRSFGPLSTSTDISVARSFAGKNGMILVIEPQYEFDDNKPFDISYLSEFQDEAEILCFNQLYEIKTVILSSCFDEDYVIYDEMYGGLNTKNETINKDQYGESPEIDQADMDIVDGQCANIQCLKTLSDSTDVVEDNNLIKFLCEFITDYNSKNEITIFESFIDSNIKFIAKLKNQINIDKESLFQFINNNNNFNFHQIKNDLIQYFANINVQII